MFLYFVQTTYTDYKVTQSGFFDLWPDYLPKICNSKTCIQLQTKNVSPVLFGCLQSYSVLFSGGENEKF